MMTIKYFRFRKNLFTGVWYPMEQVWETNWENFSRRWPSLREEGVETPLRGLGLLSPGHLLKKNKKNLKKLLTNSQTYSIIQLSQGKRERTSFRST